MSFKIVSKYLTYGKDDEVRHTVVQIVEDYPDYVAIQQRLDGDHVNEDDGTLIDKVLDLFYKKQFKDKHNELENIRLTQQLEATQQAVLDLTTALYQEKE
ncbi:hypothetical protein [Dolosicoccus paucivorans]